MKYFLDMKDEYSDVKNISEGSEAYIGNVYFGYVPEGFKYEILNDLPSLFNIEFKKQDDYFSLKIIKNKWSGQVNTEGKVIEELVINDKDMIYYENNNEKGISWNENDKTCLVTANTTKELLIEIVECIKIGEENSPQN